MPRFQPLTLRSLERGERSVFDHGQIVAAPVTIQNGNYRNSSFPILNHKSWSREPYASGWRHVCWREIVPTIRSNHSGSSSTAELHLANADSRHVQTSRYSGFKHIV